MTFNPSNHFFVGNFLPWIFDLEILAEIFADISGLRIKKFAKYYLSV